MERRKRRREENTCCAKMCVGSCEYQLSARYGSTPLSLAYLMKNSLLLTNDGPPLKSVNTTKIIKTIIRFRDKRLVKILKSYDNNIRRAGGIQLNPDLSKPIPGKRSISARTMLLLW